MNSHMPRDHGNPVDRILAAMLLVALTLSASAVPASEMAAEPEAPRLRVTKPSGGPIREVEFLDAAGNVTKRIDRSLNFATEDGRRCIDEVKIEAVLSYALVLHSQRCENDLQTRQETKKVWEIDNTITLYDEAGQVLFRKTDLECFPVALSENADKVACLLSAPHYWEGPPTAEEVYPQNDRLLVFSKRGELIRTIEEPRHQVRNVELSPSGIWLAYLKAMADHREVKLLNLITGRLVTVPVGENPGLASFEEVLDDGELRSYEHIRVRKPDGSYAVESRPKILFKVEP